MDKLDKKIAIIGVGHIGKSLMKGLLNSGFKKKNIILSNKSEDNKRAVFQADWIFLAVKPSIVRDVLEKIAESIDGKLLISVAAGVSISNIEKYLRNKKQKIIRIMPNIAISCNQGVVGLYAVQEVSADEKKEVTGLLSRLGLVIDLKTEDEIDTLTLISACSPAIIAHFMEVFSGYGVKHGLSAAQSEKIVLQSFKGTVSYLEKSNQTSSQLKQSVATKGGITEEIIKSLDDRKILFHIIQSLDKGYARIKKVKKELD